MTTAVASPSEPPAPPSSRGWVRRGAWLIYRLLQWGLLTLIAAGVGVVTWFHFFPQDLDRLLPWLTRVVAGQLNTQVVISRAALRFHPWLKLVGNGVVVFPPTGGDSPIATVGQVEVGFSLGQWLSGELPLVITLEGLSVGVVRSGEGQWLVGAGGWDPATMSGAGGSWQPLLAAVELRDAVIHYRDQRGAAPFSAAVELKRLAATLDSSRLPRLEGVGEVVIGERRVGVEGSAWQPGSGEWRVVARGGELNPQRDLLPLIAGWEPLSGMDLPLTAQVELGWGGDDGPWARWRASAGSGSLAWPRLFRWPLPVTSFTAQGTLERRDEGWRLTVSGFDLDGHAKAHGELRLDGLGGSDPQLDLTATVKGGAVDHANFYYPTTIMPPQLVTWLDESLAHGRVVGATARVKGPVKEIPFHRLPPEESAPYIFRFEADVEGGAVTFHHELPAVSELTTHLVFDRLAMSAEVTDGRLAATKGVRGRVAIADMLHHPVVEITATSDQADLESLWREIIVAMGWDRFAGLEGGKIAGTGDLRLDIALPIGDLDHSRYSGELLLKDNRVRLPFVEGELAVAGGRLSFDQDRIGAVVEAGRYEDYPLSGEVVATDYRPGRAAGVVIELESQLPEPRVQGMLQPLVGEEGVVTGKVPVGVKLRKLPGKQGFELTGTLDATGVAVTAPAVGWQADHDPAGEVGITGVLGSDGKFTLSLLEGKVGNLEFSGFGELQRRKELARVTLERLVLGESQGRLVIDSRPRRTGIVGEFTRFDPRAWIGFKSERPPRPDPPAQPERVTEFELRAASVLLANQEVASDLVLKGRRSQRQLVVETVELSHATRRSVGALTLDWDQGWNVGGFTGRFKLDTGDLGAVLRGMDWHEGLIGGQGQVALEFHGRVEPGERWSHRLDGAGKLDFTAGSIKKFQLLANLLGLLSLEELPKLLTGDFEDRPDLAGQGLYYQSLKGRFDLKRSLFSTDSLTLQGPAMRIVVAGDADYPARRLELVVGIQPLQVLDRLVNKIPVLKLLTGSRKSLVEAQYRVSGPFDKPVIELQPVASLAPGVVRDLLAVPGKLLDEAGDASGDEGGE